MEIHINKILSAIFLVMVLTVTVSIMVTPTAKAATVVTWVRFFDVSPNPVAVGDPVVFEWGIWPDPPSGYFYGGILLHLVMPDESEVVLGPFMTNESGEVKTSFIPTQIGTYSATVSYPGEMLGEYNYSSFNAGPIYLDVVEYLPPVADSVHNLDTNLNYTTIQAAIDAPETLSGHTILVDSGTYYENVVVTKSIILMGENSSSTRIDGRGSTLVVSVTNVNNVEISGFTIQNGDYGVQLTGCSYANVSGNTMLNNGYGVYLGVYSDNNIISGNNISSSRWEGINLDSSINNTISGNNINNGFSGLEVEQSSDYNTISGNDITNNSIGLDIKHSSNNIVISNTLTNNSYCLRIFESSNYTVVTRNAMENNSYGGVSVFSHSNYNIILENNITNNYYDHHYFSAGVAIYQSSSYNIIIENNLLTNDEGVYIAESSNSNIVSGNTITNNYYTGISLDEGSSNNTISGNNVSNNEYGISLSDFTDNMIYHNSFVDNTVQTYVRFSNCTWDDGYPSGGNYWSDYTGTDSDGDGIGDTPYIIDENNQDNYPLMAPICRFDAGTWEQTQYFVDCISNSTVSDVYFDPTEGAFLRFNVEGESGTSGFCRVTIPKELLHSEGDWIVLVDGVSVTPTVNEDASNTYLYFTYQHSTKTIEIRGTSVIPEFPSWTLILFILTALAVAVAIYITKTPKTDVIPRSQQIKTKSTAN